MIMSKTIALLFKTELILLLRRSKDWLYPTAFFLIVLSLFPLAFSPDPIFLKKYMPGCVWISVLLANLLSAQNLFVADKEDGHLEQVVLGQIPLSVIIIIKISAQWFVHVFPLILLTPLFAIFFQLDSASLSVLILSLLCGTPILILLSSLGAALTLGLKQQGLLLAFLILPLLIPVLIFGVNIVTQFQNGFPIIGPLAFLAGIMVLSLLFLPFCIATILKLSLDD
jgi:heme exporter protein B